MEAVVKVLRSEFLTQGPVIPRFESAVADYAHARYAVAVSSATAALHVACMALELGPGDRLWTVPNTFVASANCGRYCGAEVGFIDIDPRTWNLSVSRLADKLLRARDANCLPKVVVPVHFSGQPTEQEAIHTLAREFGFRIIEDASHSLGASRGGEPVGSCRWSDVTVFSFHPVKIITSGEGGMVLTNDEDVAKRLALLRSHGITREKSILHWAGGASATDGENEPPDWYYEQQFLGYNYRMTDIHAALGLSQLARVDAYVQRRNELARRYDLALRDMPLQLPNVDASNRSAFHLYVVRLRNKNKDRSLQRKVFAGLRNRGIGVNVHYLPVHLQPYYRQRGFVAGQYPEAEAYAESAITLPLYAAMTDAQQDLVVAALRELL